MNTRRPGPLSVQLNVRLPPNLSRSLKDQAQREDRPISRVVREALAQYLARAKQQP